MTFESKAIEYLYQNGMFEDQAKAVVEIAKAAPENEPMKGRWQDDIEGYPPTMLQVLALSLDSAAVEWIDANLPHAWFRPMFAK